MALSVPSVYEEFTAGWLTAALAEGGHLGGARHERDDDRDRRRPRLRRSDAAH
jgi:hypothetical protein